METTIRLIFHKKQMKIFLEEEAERILQQGLMKTNNIHRSNSAAAEQKQRRRRRTRRITNASNRRDNYIVSRE